MSIQTCEQFCNSQKECFAFDIDIKANATAADGLCTIYKQTTTIGYGSKANENKKCYWKLPKDTDFSTNSEKC